MLNWLFVLLFAASFFAPQLHAQSEDWESYETAQADDVEMPVEDESDEDMPPVPPSTSKGVPPQSEEGEVESDEGY